MTYTYEKRIEQLQNRLIGSNMDALLLTSPSTVYYLTGFNCHPHERFMGLFLFKDGEPVLIVPSLELTRAKSEASVSAVVGHSDSEGAFSVLKSSFSSLTHVTNWGIEKSILTIERVEWMQELFPSVTFQSIDDWVAGQRVIKDEAELTIMREAAQLADEAVAIGIAEIAVGKSEMEIVAKIEFEMKKRGIGNMAFSTTVLTGPHSAQPHGSPDSRTIQQGDMVLIDLGVVHKGYCSDITRTVFVGEPTSDQREIYEAVLAGQLAALKSIKPGVKIKEVDAAARNTITEKGFGSYFTHRLGHGLGLEVHEYPSVHGANDDMLQPGMCFTVEPGAYVPEIGGVRIEDDVVVTEEGVEILTSFTKDIVVI